MSGIDGATENCPTIGLSSPADGFNRFLAETVGAGFSNDILWGFLFVGRKRLSAGKANHSLGFSKRWIDGHSLVENETISVPMVPSDVFEIPEDTAFQLFDVGESRLDHDGARFLAPNASSAKHNDGFVFH